MTYWACSVWCITENLPSLQVSCSVNIQTGTLPANERRINVQYCIMSTSRIMTAGYFLFERMPEWGCGLQSINSWCGLSLTHSHWGGSETWGAPVSAPLLWRPKTVKWTWRRVGGKTHRDKSGQKLTSVTDAVSGTSARLFIHNMLWRRAETCRNAHARTLLPLFTVFKSKHTLQTWKAVLSQRTVTGKEVKSDELFYRGRQEQTTDANSRHPSRNFSPESAAMSAA